MLCSLKSTQVISELGHEGNTAKNADARDGSQINAKEALQFLAPWPRGLILTSFLAWLALSGGGIGP